MNNTMNNFEKITYFLLTYCNIRVILGCILLIIFAVSFFISSLLAQNQAYIIDSFSQTTGKITKCVIEHQMDSRNNFSRYGLRIHYEYVVDNISYCGTDIIDSYSSLAKAKNICEKFKKNDKPIIVYYDPKSHSVSVINKGFLYLITRITFSVAICLILCAMVSFYFRNNPFFCGAVIASDVTTLI